MPAKRFDSSDDPAFDLRAAKAVASPDGMARSGADMKHSQQEVAVEQEDNERTLGEIALDQDGDVAGGAVSHAVTPQAVPDDDDPSTIEQIGNDLGAAAEDALIAGLAAAPPVAAVVAVINQGEELLEAAEDGAKWVGGALDDVGDLFAVDKVVVGESTFPVDPDAVPHTREEMEAENAEIYAQADAIRANQEHFDELGGGGGYVFNADPDGVTDPLGDIRLQDTVGLDNEVTTGVTPTLDLDPGIVGEGATRGAVTGAPDDVMEPVAGLSPDVAIGADPGVAVDQLPTANLELADVPVGADVQLNPQPIPPGFDLHPPSPILEAGAEVSLNPQPIPPGMGADIGEPLTETTLDQAPSVSDSSIIIVGGTEAPLLADDAGPGFEGGHEVNIAEPPMDEDVASTLAADVDGPAFHAIDIDEPGVDVGFTEDEFEG